MEMGGEPVPYVNAETLLGEVPRGFTVLMVLAIDLRAFALS